MDEDKSKELGQAPGENTGEAFPGLPDIPQTGTVINPAGVDTSPNVSQPGSTEPTFGKVGGSKVKKTLIILLVILLVAGAGVAVYFFLFNKSETESPSTTPEPETSQFAPSIYVVNENKISYLDQTAELQDYATLNPNQEVVEVTSGSDNSEVRYATITTTDTGAKTYTGYGKIEGGEPKEILSFTEGLDYYSSSLVTSPDGSKLIGEVSENGGDMQKLVTINTADGQSTTVYEPATTEGGWLVFVDWLDEDNVLVQHQTCRQCDGPRLPKLSKLNLVSKQLTNYFSLDDDSISYAEFTRSINGEVVYMKGGDFSKVFEVSSTEDYGPDVLMSINKADAKSTTLLTFDGTLNMPGETANSESVFTASTPITFNGDTAVFGIPVLDLVAIAGADKTAIPIESKYVKEDTSYEQIASYGNGVLILVRNLNGDKTQSVDTLLKLPNNTQGEATMTDLMESTSVEASKIKLFVATK